MSPIMNELLKPFQPPCGEIVATVACELEVGELTELFALMVGHECSNEFIERHVVGGKTACSILLQVGEIVLHGEWEERKAVVEKRSELHWFVALVVNDKTEIAEVTIRVVNERIEHHHIAKRLIEPFSHSFELGSNLRELASGEKPVC